MPSSTTARGARAGLATAPPAPPTGPAPRTVTLSVPTGTTFAVQLNETLSTDKSVPGDPFTATLADPIVGLDGTVRRCHIPGGAG